MREHQLRLDGERQMRELEIDAARSALEAELRQQSGEAQQLRMEQRSLQDSHQVLSIKSILTIYYIL